MEKDEVLIIQELKGKKHYPICEDCGTPFIFERYGPSAYCDCGTKEWVDNRPKFPIYNDVM